MIGIGLIFGLCISVTADQVFLAAEDALEHAVCTPDLLGNGICNRVCAVQEKGDGGDCNRKQYCGFLDQNSQCDIACMDYEHDSEDCYCDISLLGNKICDLACIEQQNDFGDCQCEEEKIGNGVCDTECMTKENKWDGGDCFEDYEEI